MELLRDKIAFLQGEQRVALFRQDAAALAQRQHRLGHRRAAPRRDGAGLPQVPRGGRHRRRRGGAARAGRAARRALHRRADAVPRHRLPPLRPRGMGAPARALRRGRVARRRRRARQGLPRRRRRGRLERGRGLHPGRAPAGGIPLGDDRAADRFRRGAGEALARQGAHREGGPRRERSPPDPLVADLASSIGARPLPRTPSSSPRTACSTSMRSPRACAGASTALQSDEDPARLGLPPQAAGLDLERAVEAPAQAVVRGRAAAPARQGLRAQGRGHRVLACRRRTSS